MSTFQITTADDESPNPRVVADDELDALSLATDADLLHDGDEGNVENVDQVPVGLDAEEPD